jgi:hypothetical protein
MTEPINLNRYRKERDRAVAQKRAAENRVRYGRRKDDREISQREGERADQDLDGKKLD